MKLTAKQYIDWALHDLVEYAKLQPIRSELPDLYGKAKLFDAAVVTNRVGRFVPVGLLLCAFMLGLIANRFGGGLYYIVLMATFAALAWGGWSLRGGYGLLAGVVLFLPLFFMDPGTWLKALKLVTAAGLVIAGWRILAHLGAATGLAFGAMLIYMPPLRDLPQEAQVGMSVMFLVAGWSILSRSVVVVALKAADGLSFTELVSELKHLSRLIPSPGSVDAFECYAALVLVFEQPVPAAKRDQLISLRQASPLGRMLTDIWIVELDAGTMYALDTPWNIAPLVPVLEEALGRRGEAAPWNPAPPAIGQRLARTSVAYATIGLVALNVLLHIGLYLEVPESESLRAFRAGIAHTEMEREGQHWRAITHTFLHADKYHIFYNMIGLLEAGRGVELLFGTGWTMALYVVTGLVASRVSDNFHEGTSLGASGAVFGMMGVLLAVFAFRGQRLSIRYRSHVMVLAAYATFALVMGFSSGPSQTNHWAHLGGLLAGMAAGVMLPFREEEGGTRAYGGWFGLAGLAAVVWAFSMAGRMWDWAPDQFEPVRSESNRLVLERPRGWFAGNDRSGALDVYNGYGAAVTAGRLAWDIRGIVTMPAGELKQYFEEMYRQAEGEGHAISRHWRQPDERVDKFELLDFEAGFIALSGGKALSVRFTRAVSGVYYHYFLIPERTGFSLRVEDIFLPLQDGVVRLQCQSFAQDAEYYRPTFNRIKSTFRSLDPAFGSMTEEAPE